MRIENEWVVFTGIFVSLGKKQAGMLVMALGGHVQSKVTKQTTLVVVGTCKSKGQALTYKQKETYRLQREGQEILLLTEKEFLLRINQAVVSLIRKQVV